MTPEQAIRARLLATPAVTAIVASRIYEIAAPESPTVPLIVIRLVSEPVEYHLRGPVGTITTGVQIDGYVSERAISASDDPGANLNALGAAIDASLSGQVFTAGSPASIQVTGVFRRNRMKPPRAADELRYLRVIQDYIVWSKVQ